MALLNAHGISIMLPPSWDGRIYRPGPPLAAQLAASQSASPIIVHAANFALPPNPGDFAGGAIESLGPGGILMVLLEYPGSVGQALFRSKGIPIPLDSAQFHPNQLQRARPGHVGLQRFFQTSGRAFCLYAVVFDQPDRAALVNTANGVLGGVTVFPTANDAS
jgi:hypothetical protein